MGNNVKCVWVGKSRGLIIIAMLTIGGTIWGQSWVELWGTYAVEFTLISTGHYKYFQRKGEECFLQGSGCGEDGNNTKSRFSLFAGKVNENQSRLLRVRHFPRSVRRYVLLCLPIIVSVGSHFIFASCRLYSLTHFAVILSRRIFWPSNP